MRRVLRVHAVFEPARSSEEQLALAYEHVVPTVRCSLYRREDAASTPARPDLQADSTPGRITP